MSPPDREQRELACFTGTHERPRSWIAALVLVAIVPAAAGFAYFVLGNPPAMSPQTMAAGNGAVSEDQIARWSKTLRRR